MTNNIDINLVIADNLSDQEIPSIEQFQYWVQKLVTDFQLEKHQVAIQIVDEQESQEINYQYRQKNYPTNILSFPFEMPEFEGIRIEIEQPILGDLIICKPVVKAEATQQKKDVMNHWAHLVIHGMLHLLGYDHIEEDEAQEMESIEVKYLQGLGIEDPYIITDDKFTS